MRITDWLYARFLRTQVLLDILLIRRHSQPPSVIYVVHLDGRSAAIGPRPTTQTTAGRMLN